jgi:hypothetical protein
VALAPEVRWFRSSRRAEHPVYAGMLAQAFKTGAKAKTVKDRARGINQRNDKITEVFGHLAGRPAAEIFPHFMAFLKNAGMDYQPAVGGVDVIRNPAGPADCSSVAQGLARVFQRLGIEGARRVDCGEKNFLTKAVGGDALAGNTGLVEDTSGEFPGRRYWFPTHYVTDAPGGPYCGVVGAVWNSGSHVETDGRGLSPSGYEMVGEHPGFLLKVVLKGAEFGIAHAGDDKKIVRIAPKAAE